MGVSTDGLFFYGVCWDDEDAFDIDDHDDVEDWLCAKLGGPVYDGGSGFWEARDAFLAKHFGDLEFEFGIHCHYECAMRFIAIKSTSHTARRGFPVNVKVDELTGDYEKWNATLRAVCEHLVVDGEPVNFDDMTSGWWLASLWG